MKRLARITALTVTAVLTAALCFALGGEVGSLLPVATAEDEQLVYSVPDARAYATKISISEEVIRASSKCYRGRDDQADTPTHRNYPYNCDKQQYEHTFNCPPWLTFGAGYVINITEPAVSDENKKSGGADFVINSNTPLATPVQLQDINSNGRLTDLLGVQESGGFASRRYVDNDGRGIPTAHTESDGFSVNRANYEERCYPVDDPSTPEFNEETSDDPALRSNFHGNEQPPRWTHVFSKSGTDPITVHYSKCSGDCQFADNYIPASARESLSIVKLYEKDGKLNGELYSLVEGLQFGSVENTLGAMTPPLFTADSVVSYARFTSDGTKDGLHWTIASAASGTTICGRQADLAQGEDPTKCDVADFSVGLAAPYVNAKADGRELTMVAPGLVMAINEELKFCQINELDTQAPCVFARPQTAYFAGLELRSSQDRSEPFTLNSNFDFGPLDTFSALGTAGYSLPVPAPPQQPKAQEGTRTVAIKRFQGSSAPAGTVLMIGALGLMLVMLGWIRRFRWGRSVYRMQPFRFFSWFYRAFIRT